LIETLIDPSPSASAFDLLDAVITGRRDDALAKLAIIRRTEDPYKFMGLLASQLFTLALAVHADGRSPQVIAQESSQHPYVVQKLSQLANLIDAARLETLVRSARVCDISLKSKGAEPWMVIEAMIGTLGSEKTPR